MIGNPQFLFHILKQNIKRLCVKNIMNFYRTVFPGKNFLENIHKKDEFWGTDPLIFTLSGQSYEQKL